MRTIAYPVKFCKFTNSATDQSCFLGYWSLLRADYATALPLFDAGDAYAAGIELGRIGYYTARAEPYSREMAQLYQDWPG